jgi:hypothetical protein
VDQRLLKVEPTVLQTAPTCTSISHLTCANDAKRRLRNARCPLYVRAPGLPRRRSHGQPRTGRRKGRRTAKPAGRTLDARLPSGEYTRARATQPDCCRGPRTPGHIPGIATPIHLPSTADTPSMYFSWTAQRRDRPHAEVHRPGSVAGGSPRTDDRAGRAWPAARRPSASVSLCRAADGLADPSALLPLPLAGSFGPGLLLAGVCVVHGGHGPQHDRGPGPAVGEGAGLRAVPVRQRTFLLPLPGRAW